MLVLLRSSATVVLSKHNRTIRPRTVSLAPIWFRSRESSSFTTSVPDENAPLRSRPRHGNERLLNDDQRKLWERQRDLTERARKMAREVGTDNVEVPDDRFLDGVAGLESTFVVVVAGEFNVGKSTFVNALLGQNVLESGTLPTTDTVTVLTNGDRATSSSPPPGVRVSSPPVPVPLLRDVTLVDTPGTNSASFDHTARTLRLLPSADLVMFLTSTERPLSRSERDLLERVRERYRRRTVVVLNKTDALEGDGRPNRGAEEKERVRRHVVEGLPGSVDGSTDVFAVSAKDALGAKLSVSVRGGNADSLVGDDRWERSRFGELEDYLRRTLTSGDRVRTKLSGPLGSAEGIAERVKEVLKEKDLETDEATLRLVSDQLEGWERDTRQRAADGLETDVGVLFEKEAAAGERFLERSGSWGSFRAIVTRDGDDAFAKRWKEFSGSSNDLADELDELLKECAESITEKFVSQSQALVQYLGNRPIVTQKRLVGSIRSTVPNTKEVHHRLLARLRSTVFRELIADGMSPSSSLVHYDPAHERELFLRSSRSAAAAAAGVGVAASVAAATSLGPDPVAAASLLLVAAAAPVLAARFPTTAASHRQRATRARDDVVAALADASSREIRRFRDGSLAEGVDPYRRYVETERGRVERLLTEADDVLAECHALRNDIAKLGRD